jgi:tetratricopeptide (TPR) repeat protein
MGKLLVGLIALAVRAAAQDGSALNQQGRELYVAARYVEAEALYRRAIEAFGEDKSLDQAFAIENLGVTLRAQGRFTEAKPLLEEALGAIERLTGPESPETMRVVSNIAALNWSSGNLPKAEEAALRANDRQILASVYLGQHRYEAAAKLLRAILESAEGVSAAVAYGNLTVAALGMNQMPEAEDYARRGAVLALEVLPEKHPYRAVVFNNLAQACRFNGRYMEAERYYRDALSIWEATLGDTHPDFGRGLMNLAAFYHERGREAGAEQLYLRALGILENREPVLALVVRNELADVLRAELRYTEAEKLARGTLAEMEATLRPDDPRMARAWLNWARLLNETRRRSEAAKVVARVSRELR